MKKIIMAAFMAVVSSCVWANAEVPPDVLARSVTDEVLAIVKAD